MRVAVLIPALNEEQALPLVLADLRAQAPERVVVVDNGSTDRTAACAVEQGAELVHEPRRGYGRACLTGLAHLRADPPEVVVILDGDHSDHVEDLPDLLAPIARGEADLVLGERVTRGQRGALLPQQRFGNRLASVLMWGLVGRRYLDMGPFRAARWEALERLGMSDPAYGWNVEMQMKAIRQGLRVLEVPVRYRPRVGQSKISGTLRGSARAGAHILRACWRHR